MDETRIILARHGHTTQNGGHARRHMSGRTDYPLSTRGWDEAQGLRRWFASLAAVGALYSSPLRRAFDTAAVMGCGRGIEPRTLPDLQEIDCGMVDGEPIDVVQQRHPGLWAANVSQTDDYFRWPGGESYRDLRARSLRAVEYLGCAHPGQLVVAVTHAGLISQVLGRLTGLPPARWEAFRPENGSLTELVWKDGEPNLVRFDARDHLQSMTRTHLPAG